jgi:hypothetical protein
MYAAIQDNPKKEQRKGHGIRGGYFRAYADFSDCFWHDVHVQHGYQHQRQLPRGTTGIFRFRGRPAGSP